MKKFYFVFLLITLASIVKSQTINVDCYNDSLFYSSVDTIIVNMLRNNETNFYNRSRLAEELFTKEYFIGSTNYRQSIIDYGEYSNCEIKKVAHLFDLLLTIGVKPNELLPAPTCSRNSRITSEQYIPKINQCQKAYDLFFLFCNIKKFYEFNNRYIHSNEKKISYIDNVISFGSYRHPLMVRDILLLKYKHITRDKFNDDMKHYNRVKNR